MRRRALLSRFSAGVSVSHAGLIVSACLYAVGAGLLEVIVSPIVEACPTKRKEAAMGFLHSVFCWGSVFVVLVSTLLFSTIGIAHWRLIACLWAIIPAAGAVLFFFVPLYSLPQAEDEQPSGFRSLAKNGVFWVLCLLMVCAGATEQAISQWASTFAEKGTRNFQISGRPRGSHGVRRMYGIVSGLLCEISPQNLP